MLNTHVLKQPLVSNGYTLSTSTTRLGWLEPTQPTLPMEALREQYRAQGYIWLKGLLDREVVLAFRRRFFAAFRETALLAAGSDPMEGLYSGVQEPKQLIHKIWMEAVRWPEYEAFCMQPAIWRFYEAFLGGTPYLHKRKLIRFTAPGDTFSTPGHYDLVYLRAGTDRIYSSWIPLGDVPVEMGGLIYLEGSDAMGRTLEAEFAVKNADLPPEERINAYNKNMLKGGWIGTDLPTLADRFDARWLIANYEAGDMVIHSPYMIHAATENVDSSGRMRLSTDIRYQRADDEIDPRWREHFYAGDNL